MKFVDQSYKDLKFSIFEGSLDLSKLTILNKKSIIIPELHIDMYILGSSHLIRVKFQEKTYNELFACSADIDANALKFSDIPPRLNLSFGDLRYVFSMSLLEEVDVSEYDLKFVFPDSSITAIKIALRAQEVIFNTIHEYPREERAVYTESIFETRRQIL